MTKDYQNSLIIGLALTLGVAIAGFVGFVVFLTFDARNTAFARLPSRSMEPALLEGDFITWSRLGADDRASQFRRGEVVVFLGPTDSAQQYMKRVVGLPGDTIAMTNSVVAVNGRVLNEPYAAKTDSIDPVADEYRWQRAFVVGAAAHDTARYVPSRDNWGPLVVPRDRYFVLGDRRDESLDSRYFGFVPASQILGRVRRVYFSRDSTGAIRWSRIGHLVR